MSATQYMRFLFLLTLVACDWEHQAFFNSVPISGDPAANPVVHVYLGVDGLPYEIVAEALEYGVLPKDRYGLAEMLSVFPSSSDVSWTSLLRTQRIDGYELHYFDPQNDSLENNGYAGLVQHGLPTHDEGPWPSPTYYHAFDYHADGYLDALWSYVSIENSFGETLDNLFINLDGRAEHQSAFFGYILEIDVLGHMRPKVELESAFYYLLERIEAFKERHPERRFVFTLISDHGIDFTPAEPEHFVDVAALLHQSDIQLVDRLQDGREGLFAVPIIHTPISYVSLHTLPEQAEAIAQRVSADKTVELTVARLSFTSTTGAALPGYAVYQNGERVLHFGYVRERDQYVLRDNRLLVEALPTEPDSRFYSDEEIFSLLADTRYPDLLFRVRSALEPIAVRFPADVIVSFRRPYTSAGFQTGSSVQDQARFGFHGNIDRRASAGVILSEDTTLPRLIRSDSVLDFLPELQAHMKRRGVWLRPQVLGESLDYSKL